MAVLLLDVKNTLVRCTEMIAKCKFNAIYFVFILLWYILQRFSKSAYIFPEYYCLKIIFRENVSKFWKPSFDRILVNHDGGLYGHFWFWCGNGSDLFCIWRYRLQILFVGTCKEQGTLWNKFWRYVKSVTYLDYMVCVAVYGRDSNSQ